MAYLSARNAALDRRFADIAEHYKRHGEDLAVRWDYAFFQMMVETAHLSFRRANGQPGTVRPAQNNFVGLGATGGGEPGESFADVSSGVKAHLQHLLLYAGQPVASPIAERTRKVQEWGILTSWQRSLRRPAGFADLATKWAPLDSGYAAGIASVARRFYDGFCQMPEPRPGHSPMASPVASLASPPRPLAAERATGAPSAPPRPLTELPAIPPPLSAPRPAVATTDVSPTEPALEPAPRITGADLARLANERAREEREPNTRWGLGMAERVRPLEPPAPQSVPADTLRILNEAALEDGEPQSDLSPTSHSPRQPAPVATALPPPAASPTLASGPITVIRRKVALQHRSGPATVAHPHPASSPADEAVRTLVSGRTVHIDAALGMSIPVIFRPDGTMRGHGGGLAFALGASVDEGRWWIQRGRLCKRWNVWLERETQCLRLRQAGTTIHWVRDDGKTGTARYANR